MEIVRPRWTSATFLLYAGGYTVLVAALSAFGYLSGQFGNAAQTGWALLIFAVLLAIAVASRPRHRIVAGVFAVAALTGFVLFVGTLWTWFGWVDPSSNSSPLHGFHVGFLSLELVAVLAAAAFLRAFRFPLLVLALVQALWLFVTDLLSDGGNWSAVVTLLFALALLVAALIVDAGERRPYGFWLHVGAGVLLGGALIYFWHSGDWRWSLIAIGGVLYIGIAAMTGRSSWAVLGFLGLLAAAGHFTVDWWLTGLPFFPHANGSNRPWVPPVVFAVLGFLVVALGVAVSRRERRSLPPSAA